VSCKSLQIINSKKYIENYTQKSIYSCKKRISWLNTHKSHQQNCKFGILNNLGIQFDMNRLMIADEPNKLSIHMSVLAAGKFIVIKQTSVILVSCHIQAIHHRLY
jgi:hypothetical protein